ncbi:MAG: N-acyl homoserine lactonase family protein [Chloroflexota bacterium]
MIHYTIHPLLTGYQILDKAAYATYGVGVGQLIEVPVFAFLLQGGGRKILVDTGMSDTKRSVDFHHNGRQEPGQAIHEQLGTLGIAPDEIETIIFTHLHWDHCYNLDRFPTARLVVSEIEYRFALDPIPFYWTSYEHPNNGLQPPFQGRRFDLVQGEEEIVEGVRVFPTPGHSPGHQAVSVRTAQGLYVLAGDLFFTRENFAPHPTKNWPLTPIGRFCDIIALWHSMEDTIRRADCILMTHDPSQMGTVVYP